MMPSTSLIAVQHKGSKVHVSRGHWANTLCGRDRTHWNDESDTIGEWTAKTVDETPEGVCKICAPYARYLAALDAWRDEGKDGPRPHRSNQLFHMSGPAA